MHTLIYILFLLNFAFSYGLLFPKTTTQTTTTIPAATINLHNKEPHSDVILLNQIVMQESALRLKLEETVKQLMIDLENVKKQQSASDIQISTLIQAKADQEVLNRQLQENITSVRVENQNLMHELSTITIENEILKQELLTIKNSSVLTLGLHSCDCNIKNVTEELKDFKTNFRYMTLSLLDIQQKTDVMQGLCQSCLSYQRIIKTM